VAVTISRALSNTFAGIRPTDVPAFILAQLAGAICAVVIAKWLLQPVVKISTGSAHRLSSSAE
jgi:glycerol uptake facilitator-like aquaporin